MQFIDSVKSEYESSDCTKSDRRDGQSIQPGKLADESQIGGLSSLFTPQKIEPSEEQTTINGIIENDTVPKPPKKRYTESPFQSDQKRECKADLFGEKKRKRAESNNNEQHEMVRFDLLMKIYIYKIFFKWCNNIWFFISSIINWNFCILGHRKWETCNKYLCNNTDTIRGE